MKTYPVEPRFIPGSTTLTAEMADELEQQFGLRYSHIANGAIGGRNKHGVTYGRGIMTAKLKTRR